MTCVVPDVLLGYGAVLQYQNPLTDEWVTVAGTSELSFPEMTRGVIELNTDTADGWVQKMPNPRKRQSSVNYTMDFHTPQWFVLRAMLQDNRLYSWRIVNLFDPAQFWIGWCGFLTNMGATLPKEEVATNTITIEPSGKPSAGYLIDEA